MLATIQFRILFSCLLTTTLKIKIHKIIILLSVLHGCVTCSLTCENMMLRGIFVSMRLEKTAE